MHLLRFALVFLLYTYSNSIRAEYFVIKDYKVDMKVIGKEGVIQVDEIITVEFSEPRRGIFRKIPYIYKVDGNELEIKISDANVEDYHYTTYTEGSDYVIKIGDKNVFIDGVQTYHISYSVKKAFLLLEDHTEFYWNILGNGWPVDVQKLRYKVTLDETLPMTTNDYRIYTGIKGDTAQAATLNYYMGKFEGETTKPFGPHEGLTLAINLPKEYVKRPSDTEMFWEKYGKAGIGGFLFLIFSGLFYGMWSKYGKDYPIVRMVQYVPPQELNPAEAGVLIDEKADNVDILALLPYWAHNGNITMRRIPSNWGKDDHELNKIANLPDNAGPYEKIIFDGLFRGRNKVLVSDLENSFYQYMQSAKSSLKDHLHNMGVYYPVSVKMQIYSMIGAVLLAFMAVFSSIFFESIALGIGLGLASILGFIFANYMLKKNEKGVHLYQQVLGFKMFVKAAEKDKIEWLLKEDPDYFEKTLPYAMIFGYAKTWSKKFDGLLTEPPKWYVTPTGYYHGGMFTPSEFGTSFNSSINEIQSVFSSVPASSGGGGSFSGGGSSGGGFGGGGGGSW